MKKFLVLVLGSALFAAPALAFADSGIPSGPTPLQLLTRVAALEAQQASMQSGQTLVCAALFSTSTAQVGQQVALAWGSVGSVEQTKDTLNMWPLGGGSLMSFATTGTWSYPFTFYNATGGSTTCTAKINVL